MSTRKTVLWFGVAGVLATTSFLVWYKWSWILAKFARDSENAAEVAKLANANLAPPPVADVATGWPHWRGPTRDGRAPAGPFRTDWDASPPKLLWSAESGGGYSSCSVVGGRVYVQDRHEGHEHVRCLNADNGLTEWEYRYPADYSGTDGSYATGPRGTPTVHEGRVYTLGGAGKLLCLEAPAVHGGQPVVHWQHDLMPDFEAEIPKWGFASSPLLVGDLVVVHAGGKKGCVVAFDRTTGEQRWAVGSNPPGYSSPIAVNIGGQPTIFSFVGDALLAIRTDGTVTDTYRWKTSNEGNIATPLHVPDPDQKLDYIFISSAYGMGCAFLRAELKGDEVRLVKVRERRERGFQNHFSASVFRERHLFGFNGMQSAARLWCVNFDSGLRKEDWEADGIGQGTLILAGKYLIVQTERGELCLIEATPEEFRLVWKKKLLTGNQNWATPTLVDGRLYLRDDEKVVCYDVR